MPHCWKSHVAAATLLEITCRGSFTRFIQSGGHKLISGEAGPGQGPIWMNNVGCIGNETHIERCTFDGWGKHDCLHREDAAVFCDSKLKLI